MFSVRGTYISQHADRAGYESQHHVHRRHHVVHRDIPRCACLVMRLPSPFLALTSPISWRPDGCIDTHTSVETNEQMALAGYCTVPNSIKSVGNEASKQSRDCCGGGRSRRSSHGRGHQHVQRLRIVACFCLLLPVSVPSFSVNRSARVSPSLIISLPPSPTRV